MQLFIYSLVLLNDYKNLQDNMYFFVAATLVFWPAVLAQDLPAIAEIYHDTGVILQGKETNFFCLVSNIQPNHVVQFSHNDIKLTANSRVIDRADESLYKVIRVPSSTFTRFYLTLTNTSREDDGLYGCHVLASSESNIEVSSSFVSLSVYYLPLSSYPACEHNSDSLTFIEGDQVTLSCLSTGGNPPISLTWEGLGQSSTTSSSTTVSAEGLMKNKLTLQPQDGVVLTCRLNFDEKIFTDISPRNCSIGPFTILPRPVVILEPFHVKVEAGSTSQFKCVVKDVPDNARVHREWSASPSIPSNRFFLSLDKTIALIQNVSIADNKTIVTCRASTILASVEAYGMLTVGLKDMAAAKSTQESLESTTPTNSNETSTLAQRLPSTIETTPRRSRNSTSATKMSTSIESTFEQTSHLSEEGATTTMTSATKNEIIRLEQAQDTEACHVNDNYLPYIIAIIASISVALLAIVADILLLLKLFQHKTVARFD
ncbi:uncharacterized protein [Amphiura filiformis]|uniref:uncharacterized protein n=1 Tax=Amphiura filiformis TaxID=82378 RepID=UPI003B21708A